MTSKSDAFSIFLQFKLQVVNMLDCPIKCLWTDGGGEFINASFHSFLAAYGISHQVSFPYTPEQNRCAERKHRHIVEIGLTLMFQASMHRKYWVDAVSTTVFLINRMPMRSLHFLSPWERLHHAEPHYTDLRVFGCACFPWLKPYTCNKLEPRSKQCLSRLQHHLERIQMSRPCHWSSLCLAPCSVW